MFLKKKKGKKKRKGNLDNHQIHADLSHLCNPELHTKMLNMLHPFHKSNISIICCLFSLRINLKADGQEKNKRQTHQMWPNWLLRDLSQISPSLNKHKGVFGRQLHFASRDRQA